MRITKKLRDAIQSLTIELEQKNRELEIEAALERVRARTMAMHSSADVDITVITLFEELVKLGLDKSIRSGIAIMNQSKMAEVWTGSTDPSTGNIFLDKGILDMGLHPLLIGIQEAWEAKKPTHTYLLEGDDLIRYFKVVNDAPDYSLKVDFEKLPEKIIHYDFFFPDGFLFAFSPVSFSDESEKLFSRFATVFAQTYRRFLDLQKAEMQTKEALKRAALDRVRGEIASMRSTEDLNRITPVIWRELTSLDVPFIRCGVFIVDEASEVVEVYLTTPKGEALGVLHLPFDVNTQTINTVKYWKEQKVYREHWDAKAFTEWTQSMIEMGQVKNFADYQGAAKIPDELHLHFVPFNQGMLYVGDINPLQDEKIELVKTLAEAFSIAYARYEDFARLECAKSEVEAALAELKATQAQLIQSEKMASLGELTAGIAHEIQNPLNFVNNFSEVSMELLDEMNEEMENGDLDEARAIAHDLKLNLKKINHHGRRADGIVKGMLQHSRKSAGEKTPTHINKLADEYLRLAYHGVRAKDKSFNVTLHTDFDPELEPLMVIPPDIGRVLLNLISNAFYACTERSRSAKQEKKKSNGTDYQPAVTISTRKGFDHITIAVKDNGNGIPQKVLDKIFQPFFTTKPTGQGTGLGLSLSYDIVKAHNGRLEVETEEGAYTMFKIILPN